MPRIEILPRDFDPKSGDGSPTVDVCFRCAQLFDDDLPLSEDALESLHGYRDGDMVGSTECAHPPYDDDFYVCEVCDDKLKSPRDD